MQSECTAASPQLISAYAWKLPLERPAIFERASKLISGTGGGHFNTCAQEAEHPSVPWKAYLASREFQHLASGLAETIFNARPRLGFDSAPRPASLTLDARVLPAKQEAPRRGILAPALPQDTAASQADFAGDISIAA